MIKEMLKDIPFDDKVKVFNEVTQELYEWLGVNHPSLNVQLVPAEKVQGNDYNPNKVSEDNLKLLTQSILTNGWTLPIVVRPDYTIIDGFHRWTVAGREPLKTMLGGKVPVVIVDHHGDESADVYGKRKS